MPIEYYIHTPNLDIQNERRAICYIARQLQQRYQESSQHYILVGNIDPRNDPEMRRKDRISQLEGILIGQQSISIIEFKNYFDPIRADDLDGYWVAEGLGEPQIVRGGKRDNPYLQAKHARGVWKSYLREKSKKYFDEYRYKAIADALKHVSYYLLFHPYLHKKSTFPNLGSASNWLYIRGVRAILELTYAVRDEDVYMTPDDIRLLAETVLHATPWDEMNKLLQNKIGYLCVYQPSQTVVRYPLYCFQEFSIGRSSTNQGHQVDSQYDLVSGTHAQIVTERDTVFVQDLSSSNGTYVNQNRLQDTKLVRISSSDRIYLGGQSSKGCVLWFETPSTRSQKDTVHTTRKTIRRNFGS